MRTISFDTPASPASLKARASRIAASDYAAIKLAMRRERYFPDTTGGPGFNGLTSDRPTKCRFDNAGRDVQYID